MCIMVEHFTAFIGVMVRHCVPNVRFVGKLSQLLILDQMTWNISLCTFRFNHKLMRCNSCRVHVHYSQTKALAHTHKERVTNTHLLLLLFKWSYELVWYVGIPLSISLPFSTINCFQLENVLNSHHKDRLKAILARAWNDPLLFRVIVISSYNYNKYNIVCSRNITTSKSVGPEYM